ncbi:hypothetical protein QN219_22745 [Sinorhizobium sp. 7-81]|uniref:hypothetical protein n=1 Tax=Sinorhizobium sp. 8-89 TaxID=3049089 RepID=UPI0024C2D36C|nr:hypothetical protein [Sinorhizobium sp. 8-89]MDK1492845.1 hypothetical protein [Sinorhizobium sp. 8-89]
MSKTFNFAASRRFLAGVLVGALAHFPARPSSAEDRILNEKPFEITGVAIAKSGSVQLADLSANSYDLLDEIRYIPAGTPLLLPNQQKKDRRGAV